MKTVILFVIFLFILFISFVLLKTLSIRERLHGAGGCDWNSENVINNLYLIHLKRKNGENIIYAKFGSKTLRNETNDFYYGEFEDHVKKFESMHFKNAVVCKDYNDSDIIKFVVFNIPKINFHEQLERLHYNDTQSAEQIEIIYHKLNKIFDSYGFSIGNFWRNSITSNLVELTKMNFLENMSTALLEQFGHLACADVLKEYLQQHQPEAIYNYLKFFNASDRTSATSSKQIKFHCGYTYAAEQWAFSNSCEFVAVVFPPDYQLSGDLLILMTKQILYASTCYLLHFINSYYAELDLLPRNLRLSASTQVFLNSEFNFKNGRKASNKKIFKATEKYVVGCAKISCFPDSNINTLDMSAIKTVTTASPMFYIENEENTINIEIARLRNNMDFLDIRDIEDTE